MTTKSKLRIKLGIVYLLSIIASVLPLLICLIVNREKFFTTPGDVVKTSIGGMILLVFVFLKTIGKLKMPRRVILFGLVFALSYLLQSLLQDLTLLSGLALIGEGVDYIIFQPILSAMREKNRANRAADVTEERVEKLLQQYIGSRG